MIAIDDYSFIGDNMTTRIININGEYVLYHVNHKKYIESESKDNQSKRDC